MTVQGFKSSPLIDAILFSGQDVSCERQVTSGLIGQAKDKAFKSLKESYVNHKQKIESLSYGKFLKDIQVSLKDLKNFQLIPVHRVAVANKLFQMANDEISKEQNSLNSFQRFLLRMQNLFSKNLSFKTPGELGKNIARKLQKMPFPTLKQQVYAAFFPNHLKILLPEGYELKILMDLKDQINELPDSEFTDLLENVVLSISEYSTQQAVAFYNNLSEEKRKIFDEKFVKNGDWVSGATRMKVFAQNNSKIYPKTDDHVISNEMVECFRQNPEYVIRMMHCGTADFQSYREGFVKILYEHTLRYYIRNEKFNDIISLVKRPGYPELNILYDRIISSRQSVLTADELKILKTNVQL